MDNKKKGQQPTKDITSLAECIGVYKPTLSSFPPTPTFFSFSCFSSLFINETQLIPLPSCTLNEPNQSQTKQLHQPNQPILPSFLCSYHTLPFPSSPLTCDSSYFLFLSALFFDTRIHPYFPSASCSLTDNTGICFSSSHQTPSWIFVYI